MSDLITTKFLLSNLHCPSCVSAIEDSLIHGKLVPIPTLVSASIVSSWVVIRHAPELSVSSILEALQDNGFEIVSVTSDHASVAAQIGVAADHGDATAPVSFVIPSLRSSLQRQKSSKSVVEEIMRKKHLATCEECAGSKSIPEGHPLSPSKSADTLDEGFYPLVARTNSLVVVDSSSDELWKATFAVGGMTCQSCVSTVTQGVNDLKAAWLQNVSVDLVNASATIEFAGKEHIEAITEALEDTGMEITLQDLISMAVEEPTQERVVHIRVDGMFCDSCPARVHLALASFGSGIKVEKSLSFNDVIPIATIRYTPSQPRLTVRAILKAVSDVSDELTVSIYHPPTLEQLSAKLHQKERNRLLLRLTLSIVVAIPTFLIGVVFMSLVPSTNRTRQYLAEPLGMVSRSQWALLVLATPVYLYSAGLYHDRAIRELYNLWKPGSKTPILRRFYRFGSMNMLLSLGTSVAYISSIAQLISASVKHQVVEDSAFYFDTVVFLTMFVLIGRLIEAYSKARTGDAISLLGNLRPTEALLVETDVAGYSTKMISVDLLEFGDLVRVSPGGSPPSDGIITEGDTIFDESSLTGESRPVKKTIGDQVYAGTVNKSGPITVRITGLAGNSMLDQIVKAVRDGQTQHAPIEKLVDSLTGYFVPVIVFIAILTWIVWLSLGLSGTLSDDFRGNSSESWAVWSLGMAIAVFVVACPCGIGLAAPTALVVGSGLAAQSGILAKGGGEAFEKTSYIDCVVFDKTGTLTIGGEPIVTENYFVTWFNKELEQAQKAIEFYNIISKLEESSSHPIAKAIVAYCKSKSSISDINVDDAEEIAGQGIKGTFSSGDGEKSSFLVGNESLMLNHGVTINSEAKDTLLSWASSGKSVVLVARNTLKLESYELLAVFAISDPLRPESYSLIKDLTASSIDVWMLSGDNPVTANAIGLRVGIPESNIIAGVLPAQKATSIKSLQSSLKSRNGKRRALVAMVGDGINDAPALAAADVGIAIGSGSDIAISAADFVLISSDLRTVLTLLDLSKKVFWRIKFNFAWALVYNLIGVPIAAGCLMGIKTGGERIRLQAVWASLAMALSSVSVVGSSLALRSGIPGLGFRKRKIYEKPTVEEENTEQTESIGFVEQKIRPSQEALAITKSA